MSPDRASVEPREVCQPIPRRSLLPPLPNAVISQWVVQLYTLGRFNMLINGEPVRFPRKVQRRVLDLLKVAAAFGGEEVSKAAIAGALWSEAEGDAASNAFEITLHRARKLLGRADALIISHGKLSFNPQLCWLDTVAFERLIEKLDTEEGAQLELLVELMFKLYRGHFLRNEDECAWLLPARERLRSCFLRFVARVGREYEAAGGLERAADLYQRAIEIDPLAEELYLQLMQCLARSDKHAESLQVYRRCQQMLTAVLAVAVSPKTEAARASLFKTRTASRIR